MICSKDCIPIGYFILLTFFAKIHFFRDTTKFIIRNIPQKNIYEKYANPKDSPNLSTSDIITEVSSVILIPQTAE